MHRRTRPDDLQAAQHVIDLRPRVMAHVNLAVGLLPAISPARTATPRRDAFEWSHAWSLLDSRFLPDS